MVCSVRSANRQTDGETDGKKSENRWITIITGGLIMFFTITSLRIVFSWWLLVASSVTKGESWLTSHGVCKHGSNTWKCCNVCCQLNRLSPDPILEETLPVSIWALLCKHWTREDQFSALWVNLGHVTSCPVLERPFMPYFVSVRVSNLLDLNFDIYIHTVVNCKHAFIL